MNLDISFKEINKDHLLKFLSVLQKEIEKTENEEIKNIYNAGNFIIFGVDGHTVFIPTRIKLKDDKKMELRKISKEELKEILEKHVCLEDGVEQLVIETDEENPTPIAIIDRSDEPIKAIKGYRVRIKFTED